MEESLVTNKELTWVCMECGKKVDVEVIDFCPYCNDEVMGRKTGDSIIIGLVLED